MSALESMEPMKSTKVPKNSKLSSRKQIELTARDQRREFCFGPKIAIFSKACKHKNFLIKNFARALVKLLNFDALFQTKVKNTVYGSVVTQQSSFSTLSLPPTFFATLVET